MTSSERKPTTYPLFSLIIPVYNAGDRLLKCVESVLAQAFENYEVILVDDGSTDVTTLEIENTLERNNNQVRLFRQSNKGTSAARNLGLQKAQAKYISFLNQDDYWTRGNVFSEVNNLIESSHPDIIFSNYCSVCNGIISIRKCSVNPDSLAAIDTYSQKVLYLLRKGGITRTVWCAFFKRELLQKYQISFPDGKRYEDYDFIASCLERSKSLAWIPLPYYAYNLGVEGQQTSQTVTEEMCTDLESIILKHEESGKNRSEIRSYLAYLQFVLFCEKIKMMGRTLACRWAKNDYPGDILLSYLIEWPYVLFGKIWNVLGLSFTFWVIERLLHAQNSHR